MKRDLWLCLVALLALVGSMVAALATQQTRDFNLRGYVDATRSADLPFRVPRLGVNAELSQYSPDDLSVQLDRMEAAGITWVRQLFPWDAIEPQPGRFDWDRWDRLVQAVDARPGLRLVAVLVNTPAWARSPLAVDNPTAPPSNPADFAAFARAFAARYGTMIDHYQLWDEPNLTAAWGGLEPRPADYAALVQEAYAAIHGADENAQVLLAALAPTVETGPRNISDILYLRDLYALGIQPYMDGAAAKPYGFNLPPDDRTVDNAVLNFSRIVALREVMVANGDGRKPLWASSWGWNSLPPGWAGQPSIWGSVTAQQQVDYTLAAIDRAEREWPWLGGLILYHWQPDAPPDHPLWGFALIGQDNRETPLYQVLTQRDHPDAAQNGLFPAANPFARYSGVWTLGRMGADIGWLQDSQLAFDFTGQDVALLLRQDDYVGYLYPTIDGQPANAVPKDASGNAYIVLTSGSRSPETNLVAVARGLPNGPHTLAVTADRGWDRWALAGYAVSSGDLTAPYNRQITAAALAALVAAAAVIVTGWRIPRKQVFPPFSVLLRSLDNTSQLIISAVTSLALLAGMFLTWGDGTPHLFRREPVQLGLALVTAGVLYLEPGLILTIIALPVLFVLVYHRLDLGLMLTLFWSPFFLFPVELYRFAFPLAELILLVTAAAWLLRSLADWGRHRQSAVSQFPPSSLAAGLRRLNALDWAVIAWVALGIVSLLWAQHRPQAITDLRVMILEPALFYTIFRTTPLDRKAIVRLVDALVLAGLTVAVIGLVTFMQGQAVITAEAGARRLASVYGSPNNVGLFLGRCLPFALAFSVLPLNRTRRALAALALVVMAAAVILSQSVGALFIGIPAAVGAVVLLVWRRRARWLLLALVVVIALAFVLSLQSARFARVLDFSGGTNFFRLRVWQSAIHLIQDYPLTGVGLDQFLYAFRGRFILPDAWQEPDLSHPHNFILDFWVRLGFFGVVVFIMLQIAFWRRARRLFHRFCPRDPLFLAVVVGMIGSMVNLLAHGLIDNSVYVQDLAYVFVFLLALSNMRPIDEPL
ncbi:MAG: O-antigen ligase family protein [Chloroflexi bacterium]|nr:O-antigen ligase family protein [Chloroflexota bacterium]